MTAAEASERLTPEARRAVTAAFLGWTMDAFDCRAPTRPTPGFPSGSVISGARK